MAIERDHAREGGVWNEIGHWWEWRDAEERWHRLGGPARIADGSQAWYLHGQPHRMDGPAFIGAADDHQEWFVQGRDITTEVTSWMHDNDIAWPFTEERLVEFQLRWG